MSNRMKKHFKWIRVKFYSKENFPMKKWIERDFKSNLATLTTLYAVQAISPKTKEIKFKLGKLGMKGLPEIIIPTPIYEMDIQFSLYDRFPNAKWIHDHYLMATKRLAELYIRGVMNPSVTKFDYGIENIGVVYSVPQEYASKIRDKIIQTITIEWIISDNSPKIIDVRDLVKK